MIDATKFMVICRLMADGNGPSIASLRVKSNKDELMYYARRTHGNYLRYCRALFLLHKFENKTGDKPLFPKSWRKWKVFNSHEKSEMEKFWHRRGFRSKDIERTY